MDFFGFSPLAGEGWRRLSRRVLAVATAALVATGLWACGNGDDPPALVEASATIGAEGGTLEGPDGVVVKIPAGALTEPTVIRIAKSADGSPPAPDGYTLNGSVYEITPHDLFFLYPVTIEMPWTPVAGAGDQRPFTAAPSDTWLPIDAQVADGKAWWMTNSFSWFMVGVCAPPANDPYPCTWPQLIPKVTSSVPDAIALRVNSPYEIAWNVTKPTTLSINLAYSAARDCLDPRLQVSRRATATRPAETLIDSAVSLSFDPASSSRSIGSTLWTLPMSEADNGLGAYDLRFSCQRLNRDFRSSAGGRLFFFTEIAPQPPQAPAFVAQPSNVTVTVGEVAGFSVAASGNPAPALQWQVSSDDGATWADIAGATAASYATPPADLADNGKRFRAVATNPSGVVESDAAILTVREPTVTNWSVPATLVSNWSYGVYDIDAGFDEDGNAYLLWSGGTSTWQAWSSMRPVGGSWTTPVALGGGASDTRLAVNAAGKMAAAWSQAGVGGSYRLVGRQGESGSWGDLQRIDTGNDLNTFDHRIAIDGAGRAIVAWVQYASGNSRTVIRVSLGNGTGWSPPQDLSDGYVPAVGVDAAGRGFVAWAHEKQVWRAAVDLEAGTVGTPEAVQAPSLDHIDGLRFAMAGSGHGLLVWREYLTLKAARHDPDVGWVAPETIVEDARFDDFYLDPSIAVAGNGKAAIVWGDGGSNNVRLTLFQPAGPGAGTWSATESRNGAGSSPYAQSPRVAMSADGRLLLAWAQSDASGDYEEIWAQVHDGSWQTPQRLQDGTWLPRDPPIAAAVAGTGDLVAAWATDGDNLVVATSP